MKRKQKRFIEQSDNKFIKIAREFDEVCPKCKGIHISIRQRKTPKYYCRDCKTEFDDPKAMIGYTTQKQKDDFSKKYLNSNE